MPSGDKSGPMGQGPMTGRSLGFCVGSDTPGFSKGFGGGMGRGMSRGRGMGRGFGRNQNVGFNNTASFQGNTDATMNTSEEIKFLKSQAESIKNSMQNIEKRLDELGKSDS